MYSMKAVAELTGITPDTLRAWERRYHAISPSREANGRRIYDGADISRLRLLRNATDLGHLISRIARLSNPELQNLIDEINDKPVFNQTSDLSDKLIYAIKNYQIDMCDEILGLAATGMSPIVLARDLLGPTLVEVGALWHEGKINTAQEHLLSSSIKRMVFSLIHVYRRQASGPELVFATLAPERHELGLLMACLIASGQGARCYYLGPDIPRLDLLHAVEHLLPNALVLGVMQYPMDGSLAPELTRLRKEMPDDTALWIGGPGIAEIEADQLPDRCRLLAGYEEFSQEISYIRVRPALQTPNVIRLSDR
jgi:MerR family transcriptional regulator, light-induced transcriptional regulator